MILDFKEIPSPTAKEHSNDEFEEFAQEVLAALGYSIERGVSRGADGGKDLIVVEARGGVSGVTRIKWLVSCKHFAHSNRAVGVAHEADIRERVEQHGCDGFIGFYSSNPSSSLEERLDALKIPTQILAPAQIERICLSDAKSQFVAQRYFPRSYASWARENPEPAKIFHEKFNLECEVCRNDLLNERSAGIYVVYVKYDDDTGKSHNRAVHFVCKGRCDRVMEQRDLRKGEIDGWEDIPDLKNPTIWMRKMFGVQNALRDGETWEDDAYVKFRTFMCGMAQFALRSPTTAERQEVESLLALWDSGLG
ncbi:MAG: restriction endonuclease [Oceanicaulis sp.]